MNSILKHRFLQFCKTHSLLNKGDRVLVAVSGGVDSMVLLDLLLQWQRYYQLEIGVAHLNHMLRADDSADDYWWVKNVAKIFELPFYGEAVNVTEFAKANNLSIEAAARQLRYDFYGVLKLKTNLINLQLRII